MILSSGYRDLTKSLIYAIVFCRLQSEIGALESLSARAINIFYIVFADPVLLLGF